jgi:hypothetical protein
MVIVLVAGLAVAVAALGNSYAPALAVVMVAPFAWVLVRFLHWRRSVHLALTAAPTACAECSPEFD